MSSGDVTVRRATTPAASVAAEASDKSPSNKLTSLGPRPLHSTPTHCHRRGVTDAAIASRDQLDHWCSEQRRNQEFEHAFTNANARACQIGDQF